MAPNHTQLSEHRRTISARFDEVAAATPDRVAVVAGSQRLTYRELTARANQLAWALRERGAGPEAVVGVSTRRNLDLVVALLAVVKGGAVYLPVDPDHPAERRHLLLTAAGASLMLTDRRTQDELGPDRLPVPTMGIEPGLLRRYPTTSPAVSVTPDSLLYLLYTSGSTGQPKGIAMHHGPTVDLLDWTRRHYAESPCALQYFPVTADVAYYEIFSTWWSNGSVVVASEDDRIDVSRVVRLIREHQITRVMLPVILLEQLARKAGDCPEEVATLREVVTTGDRLLITPAIRNMFRQLPDAFLENQYGSTEVNVVTARRFSGPVDEWPDIPSIGSPIGRARVYVLDQNLTPVPATVPGHLYIGGDPVARGYLGQPDLTARSFLPDPFNPNAGARMYRMGDLARWRPDGTLEFLGRADFQIKIRGYRVEPGEIESQLRAQPDVGQAVVVATDESPDDKQLIAYLVPAGIAIDPADLRTRLRGILPAYLMPGAIVVLDRLPLTSTGKVDRKQLPAPELASQKPVTPRGETERVIAEVWTDVLGLNEVGTEDDFFSLGGHSLLVTQVVYRLRDIFGVELPLRAMFEHPTVASLAIELKGANRRTAPPLEPVSRTGAIPLSYAQQRLWFLHQLFPHSAVYNSMLALRMRGPLVVDALTVALTELTARHESLRTRFPVADDGVPRQVVEPALQVHPELADVSELPADAREVEARRLVGEHELRPFDIADGPPVRHLLVQLDDRDHVLCVVLHHIVCDGGSLELLQRELAECYSGLIDRDVPLEQLQPPVQYADYAVWQRSWFSSDVLDEQLEFWRIQLEHAPRTLELPTDRTRPPTLSHQDHAGVLHEFVLDEPLTDRLKKLSNQENVTLFMTLLAAYAVLLCRYDRARSESVVIGVPVAGRTHPRLEQVFGLFVNAIAMHADCSDDPTFIEMLARVREVALDAFANQDLPFEHLVENLQPQRDLSRNPLFQALFQLQHAQVDLGTFSGMEVTSFRGVELPAKFDLSLSIVDIEGRLECSFGFSSALFQPPTVAKMAEYYQRLVSAAVTDPRLRLSELITAMVSPEERRWLLERNLVADRDPRWRTVPELIAECATSTPDAPAVLSGPDPLTYRDLDEQANRLAHYLDSLGLAPETSVGVCIERSTDLIICLVAILKAGCVYVPMDPGHPPARLQFMIDDTGAPVVLTRAALRDRLPVDGLTTLVMDELGLALAEQPTTDPACRILPAQLAYVMYTSGSTGVPKGVMVEHRTLTDLMLWRTANPRLDDAGPSLAMSPIGFDVSIWDLLSPLVSGGSVVPVPPDAGVDRVAKEIIDRGVTVATVVPGVLRALVDYPQPGSLASLRHVVLCGEVFPVALAAAATERLIGATLHNAYGPTEGTVMNTWWSVVPGESGATVPIGAPLGTSTAYVADERMNLAPAGVPGELYLGGEQLARGYLGRQDLTAERFVPDPFGTRPGGRLYRTGDLARYRPDGSLEFLGRMDDQLKVRGFRIEPGEVESHLTGHPKVTAAVVTAHDDGRGDRILIGYLLCDGQMPQSSELDAFLRERLPGYLVPSMFVPVDRVPRTANGKVHRKALPAPDLARIAREREFTAPVTVEQRVVSSVWAQTLGLDRVGVHTDFFSLGGHSLLVPQVTARLRDLFGVEVSLPTFLEQPTVASLSAAITKALAAGDGAVSSPDPTGDDPGAAERDSRLTGEFVFPPSSPVDRPRAILLTGASGFVGAFLLDALLRQTGATVHCLVRAGDDTAAGERLRTALRRFGLVHEPNRVQAVAADLSLPSLGVSPDRLERLAHHVDTIVHCGALVHAVLGYRHLRATNVYSTRELLRLAATGGVAAFHLISTESAARAGSTGYGLSKRTAERLALEAARRGLAASVYRLPRISAESVSGTWNESDAMARLIRGSIAIGRFPELGTRMDETWIPVDEVSQILGGFVRDPCTPAGLSRLIGTHVKFEDILAWVRSYGYDVKVVPVMEWVGCVAEDPHNPAYLVAGAMLNAGSAGPDQATGHLTTDGEHILTATARSVGEDTFHRMLYRMVHDELLPAPVAR